MTTDYYRSQERLEHIEQEIAETEHALAQLRETRAWILHEMGIDQLSKYIGNQISTRTYYALRRADINNTRDLKDFVDRYSVDGLLGMRGIGMVALNEIKALIDTLPLFEAVLVEHMGS